MTSLNISFGTLADRLQQSHSFDKKKATLIEQKFSNTTSLITSILETIITTPVDFFDNKLDDNIQNIIFSMLDMRECFIQQDNIQVEILKDTDPSTLTLSIREGTQTLNVKYLSPIQRINIANTFFIKNDTQIRVEILKPYFQNITLESQMTLANENTISKLITTTFGKHVEQCHLIISPTMLLAFWETIQKYKTVHFFLHVSPARGEDGQKYWIQLICKDNKKSLLIGMFNFF